MKQRSIPLGVSYARSGPAGQRSSMLPKGHAALLLFRLRVLDTFFKSPRIQCSLVMEVEGLNKFYSAEHLLACYLCSVSAHQTQNSVQQPLQSPNEVGSELGTLTRL